MWPTALSCSVATKMLVRVATACYSGGLRFARVQFASTSRSVSRNDDWCSWGTSYAACCSWAWYRPYGSRYSCTGIAWLAAFGLYLDEDSTKAPDRGPDMSRQRRPRPCNIR